MYIVPLNDISNICIRAPPNWRSKSLGAYLSTAWLMVTRFDGHSARSHFPSDHDDSRTEICWSNGQLGTAPHQRWSIVCVVFIIPSTIYIFILRLLEETFIQRRKRWWQSKKLSVSDWWKGRKLSLHEFLERSPKPLPLYEGNTFFLR